MNDGIYMKNSFLMTFFILFVLNDLNAQNADAKIPNDKVIDSSMQNDTYEVTDTCAVKYIARLKDAIKKGKVPDFLYNDSVEHCNLGCNKDNKIEDDGFRLYLISRLELNELIFLKANLRNNFSCHCANRRVKVYQLMMKEIESYIDHYSTQN